MKALKIISDVIELVAAVIFVVIAVYAFCVGNYLQSLTALGFVAYLRWLSADWGYGYDN
ncbi:hypothetical protein ACUIJQ_08305 [Levilactobacillus hammesii]|uniref:hypothetical protein n=1 Tax=Levilactobacillus hammesii TaxID=267633 RepID=UPI0012ECE473|nr:hypothetical protein [Levilactobacillus hammesii]